MKPEMRTAFLATDEHGFSRMIAQGGGLGGGQWSVVSGRFSVFGWAGCGWASTRARARFVAASSGFVNFAWYCRRFVDYEAEAGGWKDAEEKSPIVP